MKNKHDFSCEDMSSVVRLMIYAHISALLC